MLFYSHSGGKSCDDAVSHAASCRRRKKVDGPAAKVASIPSGTGRTANHFSIGFYDGKQNLSRWFGRAGKSFTRTNYK